jgi:DNA-binding MarR family transcriptional regulator
MTSGVLSEPQLQAWRRFLRAHAKVTRRLESDLMAEQQLPLASYDVLVQLVEAPQRRLRMSELAEKVLLSRSGLTRLVDRMEGDGLLRRVRCEDDQRGYFAEITDEGRELFARARMTHLDGVRQRFLDHLSSEEQRALAAMWEKVSPGAAG